jgi:hypothetical protein
VRQDDFFTVANTHRAYWRTHPVQRFGSEEGVVAHGYDAALQVRLGVPSSLFRPVKRGAPYEREPGEDAFEEPNETAEASV